MFDFFAAFSSLRVSKLYQVARDKAVFTVDRDRCFTHTYDSTVSANELCFVKQRKLFYFTAIGICGFFDLKRMNGIVFFDKYVDFI